MLPLRVSTRQGLNLLLLLLIAVVLTILLRGETEDDVRKTWRLSSLTAAQVSNIELDNRRGEVIKLERRGEVWWMVEPLQVPANPFRVRALLRFLDRESNARYSVSDIDPVQFQLDGQYGELILNDNTRFIFGMTESIRYRRYVQVNDYVYLISDPYYQVFIDLPAMVALELLPNAGAGLSEIHLPDRILKLGADGLWHDKRQGRAETLEGDRINAVVDAWRGAQALSVARYRGYAGQGAVELNQVALILEDGSKYLFDVIDDDGDVILGRADLGLQFYFTASQKEAMFDFNFDVESDSGQSVSDRVK